jgi:uncharacterized protein YbaR (Trm112 family)
MSGVLEQLADLLRCPVTGQQLRLADPGEVAAIAGKAPADSEGFLVREDAQAAYPVRGGIPDLLPESLIPLGSTISPIS